MWGLTTSSRLHLPSTLWVVWLPLPFYPPPPTDHDRGSVNEKSRKNTGYDTGYENEGLSRPIEV